MKRSNRICQTYVRLSATWILHNAGEYLTTASASQGAFSGLPEQLPTPEEFRERGVPQAHVSLAMSTIDTMITAPTTSGVRNGGRSTSLHDGLLVFKSHGFTYTTSCLVAGGCTTGAVTSLLMVIPYWLRAWRILKRHEIRPEDPKAMVMALAVFPAPTGIHALTREILGGGSLRSEVSGTAV